MMGENQNEIQQDDELTDKERDDRDKDLRHSFTKLALNLAYEVGQPDFDKSIQRHIFTEVRSMFSVPEIQDELQKHFGGDLSQFSPMKLCSKINDGSISGELLYAAAKRHAERMEKQREQLEEIGIQVKKEFKEAVIAAVARGALPKSAEESLPRVDSVRFGLIDRLLSPNSTTAGTHNASGKITASSEQLQPEVLETLKSTFFHELLHEISGVSITVPVNKGGGFSERKSGLVLSPSSGGSHKPNVWLNEAVTESINLELLPISNDKEEGAYNGSLAYVDERKELDRLYGLGLEKELVTNAYFENFSSDQPKEKRGEHYAKLLKRINELEGKFGHARLENKFIIDQIKTDMQDEGVYLRESEFTGSGLPEGTKTFSVSISVGGRNEAIVTKKFMFIAVPIQEGSISISVEDQRGRLESALAQSKGEYGEKLQYSISQ